MSIFRGRDPDAVWGRCARCGQPIIIRNCWSGYCRKYTHDCNGETDGLRCPEWRTIQALDQLSISIRSMISLRPGGKLIIQGMN